MIYALDPTNNTSLITSLKAALTSAGILQTLHYEDAANLIVTLTRNNRVFKFTASSIRYLTYYGTSYVSGVTIADSVTLNSVQSGTGVSDALIVTGDLLAIVEYRGATYTYDVLIGNINNEQQTSIAWGWSSISSVPLLHNTVNMTQMYINVYPKALASMDGKYYMSDVVCMNNALVLEGIGVKGLKALHMGMNTSNAYVVVGNDVIVPGGRANADDDAIFNSLYILNAVTWTP